MASKSFRPPPETCPVCGDEVPRKAWACPTCGSDYETGWSEESCLDGLDLPGDDSDFDYDDFVRNEFGEMEKRSGPEGLHPVWKIAGVILLAALLLMYLSGIAPIPWTTEPVKPPPTQLPDRVFFD